MLLFPFSTIYTSFFLVFQNSLDRCWALLQCFLQYRSGKVRWPGCGITTFDFIIRRFTGLRGARLVTSFSTSVVSGLEFMIASTSRTRVYKDRSYKLFRGIFSKEFKIALALRIFSSQTPPMLLDSGGFLFHIIHSPPVSFKKSPILIWSISWNVRVSSDDALTWFEPLLDLIILTLPPHPTNLLKFMMNESVLREYTTSTSMALLNRQVYRAPCLLTSSRPSFTRNDPSKSTPQYVNGGFSLILFPEKSVIFCCWSLYLNCLHPTHFNMIQLIKELHLLTQKREDLIWFIVMLQPARTTWSWQQRTTNSTILQDFGNNSGCCISFASVDIWTLLPAFNIPSSSMNGSNFTMLRHDIFLFSRRFILLQSVFSGQIWLSPSLPSLFPPSPMVH